MYAAFLPVGNFLTSSASDLDGKAGSCSSSCGSERRIAADVQEMSSRCLSIFRHLQRTALMIIKISPGCLRD